MKVKPTLFFGISERLLFLRVKQPLGAGTVTTILRHTGLEGGALLWEASSSDTDLSRQLDRLKVTGKPDDDFGEAWRGLGDVSYFSISDKIGNICCISRNYSVKFSDGTPSFREQFGVQNWGPMQENEDKKQEIAKHRKALAKHIVEDAEDAEILELMLLHKKLAFKKKYKNGGPPKWGDPKLSDELKRLTAPAFLKRVYDELIVCRTVEKQTIRDFDSPLMSLVEQYIGDRIRRQRNLGDAEGITFISTVNKQRAAKAEANPPAGSRQLTAKKKLSLG